MKRCDWVSDDPLYQKYHDDEWGVPVHDDQTMFEFLLLESFQAGLSWYTILKKRENFRQAFDNFDYQKIANYGEEDISRLMANAGIIRNNQKIKAAINNAQCFIRIQEEWGDFCKYFWHFTKGKRIMNSWNELSELPPKTDLSDEISKDLKKRGFKFVGSTTIYAHMQACGMVMDHQTDCFRYKQLND